MSRDLLGSLRVPASTAQALAHVADATGAPVATVRRVLLADALGVPTDDPPPLVDAVREAVWGWSRREHGGDDE